MKKSAALILIALTQPACDLIENFSSSAQDEEVSAPPVQQVVQPLSVERLKGLLPEASEGWKAQPVQGAVRKVQQQPTTRVSVLFEGPSQTASQTAQEQPEKEQDAAAENSNQGSKDPPTAAGSETAENNRPAEDETPTLKLEIIDGARVPAAYSSLAVLAHTNPNDVHKRSIDIDGHSGIEKWDPQSGSVELFVVVKDRFIVQLQGRHVPIREVEKWKARLPVKQLAELAQPASP